MAYNFKDVKVLVVESSIPMFQLVKGVLNLLTVPEKNIYASYSVEEAFASFQRMGHDLIIVDWLQNPDRGIQLTKIMRTDKATPNPFVPIIMTAGSGHLNRVIRARDSGISEYLVKPFSAKSLAERITRVIEKQRQFVVSDSFVGPDRRVKTAPFNGPDKREDESRVMAVTL